MFSSNVGFPFFLFPFLFFELLLFQDNENKYLSIISSEVESSHILAIVMVFGSVSAPLALFPITVSLCQFLFNLFVQGFPGM